MRSPEKLTLLLERFVNRDPSLNETKYWNTKRAADYLGVSPDTFNRMRLTGDCAPAMPNWAARVIYDPSDIDAWVEANKRSFTHEKITP